ncbi:MAG: 2-hydroxyacyl-CoA dehydratase [Chloroflexi bacterium]|nr:2-hydroxyacyl-CoA dehydratase [Chloroflexota bacterium]
MNIFEVEIAKYERRLKRIASSPGSNMLASNRLLYEAHLEQNREQLRWWQEGKPFISQSAFGIETFVQAFGDFQMLNLIPIADRLGTRLAEAAFEKVRAMGLPEYACDRTTLFFPLAIMGGELPRPKLIVTRTGACNVMSNSHRALGQMMGVPVFTIEVPFQEPHQEHLGYVVAQLEQLIEWIEVNLPGAKYDEEKLAEMQQATKPYFDALHDIYELRKLVPCPDHPRDVFREPVHPGQFVNPGKMIEYYQSYRDELRERVRTGFVPVGEEKMRIVWGITGPYGSGIWDYLAGRGVSVPWWQYGGTARIFYKPTLGDVTEFGRKLSPLEEVARTMLYNSWGGDGERWIRDTVMVCRDFKADGFVQFEQTGCQPVLGLGRLVAQRLEKDLGIPSWQVEERQLLGHSERTEAEFVSGLGAFIDLCFNRKAARGA